MKKSQSRRRAAAPAGGEQTSIAGEGCQVGPGTALELRFAVFDAEGECVAPMGPTLEVVAGMGQLLPAVERALEGAVLGERRSVQLKARDAYGPRRKEAILEVDPAEFPDDVAPGDHFEFDNAEGRTLVFKVLEVLPDAVVLDTNHPLAGQDVRIDVEVRAVEPATTAQLAAAERQLAAPDSAVTGLLPLESLLRGGSRR